MTEGSKRQRQDVKDKQTKRKRRRITDGLIGLSSAAVVAVYAVGYTTTQSASKDHLTQIASAQATQLPTPGPNLVSPQPGAAPGASTAPATAAVAYKDGTYVGLGTSRHGDIETTLIIEGGKIASVKISQCATRYPCSDVDPLLARVTAAQGVPVEHVSGATDSSNAFKQSVRNALAKAV